MDDEEEEIHNQLLNEFVIMAIRSTDISTSRSIESRHFSPGQCCHTWKKMLSPAKVSSLAFQNGGKENGTKWRETNDNDQLLLLDDGHNPTIRIDHGKHLLLRRCLRGHQLVRQEPHRHVNEGIETRHLQRWLAQ